MSASNFEAFESVMDNKNKARNWTLIWVTVLTLLASALVYYMVRNKELKTNLDAERLYSANKDLENKLLQAKLDKFVADSINEVLALRQENASKLATNLQNQLDTMGTIVQGIQNQVSLSTLVPNPSAGTGGAASVGVRQRDGILAQIKAANIITTTSTVFIQYMPEFADKIPAIKSQLKGYNLPKEERVTKSSFNSSVKYFNTADSNIAAKVAASVRPLVDQKVPVQKVNMAAPRGQLELWIGTYQPRLLDKVKQFKIND